MNNAHARNSQYPAHWILMLDDDFMVGPAKAKKLIDEHKLKSETISRLGLELFDDALCSSSFINHLLENTNFEQIIIFGGNLLNCQECASAERRYNTRIITENQKPWYKRLFKKRPQIKTVLWFDKKDSNNG